MSLNVRECISKLKFMKGREWPLPMYRPVIKISLEMQLAPKELITDFKSKCEGDIFVHYSLLFYVYDKY